MQEPLLLEGMLCYDLSPISQPHDIQRETAELVEKDPVSCAIPSSSLIVRGWQKFPLDTDIEPYRSRHTGSDSTLPLQNCEIAWDSDPSATGVRTGVQSSTRGRNVPC